MAETVDSYGSPCKMSTGIMDHGGRDAGCYQACAGGRRTLATIGGGAGLNQAFDVRMVSQHRDELGRAVIEPAFNDP